MTRSLSYLLGAIALLAAPSIADATVYVKSANVGSTGSYNLSVTTDNTIGALAPSNTQYGWVPRRWSSDNCRLPDFRNLTEHVISRTMIKR